MTDEPRKDDPPPLNDEDMADELALERWRQNKDPFQEDMDLYPPPIGKDRRM